MFGGARDFEFVLASAKICGDTKRRDGNSCVDEAIVQIQEPLQRMFATSNFRNEWTTRYIECVLVIAKITMVRMVWIVDEESDLNKEYSECGRDGNFWASNRNDSTRRNSPT